MSLGLSAYHTASGEFSPRLQFNAASGRFTRVTKAADGIAIIRAEYPAMRPPSFVFDIGSLEIGWLRFNTGVVSLILTPFGQPMPARPDRDHKAGFRAKICEAPGQPALEFSANAGTTVNAIEALWTLLTAAPEAAAGLVPVLQVTDTVSVGKNYAPVFALVMWIDRDEQVFGPRTVAAPGTAPIPLRAPATPTPAAWSVPTPAAPAPAAWPTPALKAA